MIFNLVTLTLAFSKEKSQTLLMRAGLFSKNVQLRHKVLKTIILLGKFYLLTCFVLREKSVLLNTSLNF